MRPARFQDYLLDLANKQPHTTARPLTEAGETRYPYGAAIRTPRGEARWQIIGQLAPGERHNTPDTPVHAKPPALVDDPGPDASPEAWLAALIAQAGCTEYEQIERWSTRPDGAGQAGITIHCHNGARLYIRAL